MSCNVLCRIAALMLWIPCLLCCSDNDPGGSSDGAVPSADGAVEASVDSAIADQRTPDDRGTLEDQGEVADQRHPGDGPGCGVFNSPIGRSLTVTYGSQTVDFSSGTFSSDFHDDPLFQESYWYFIFKSTDGAYGLELRMAPAGTACPETFPLPEGDRVVLIFFESATFTEIASGAYPGASGALTIESYITTTTQQEMAFTCASCALQPAPGGSAAVTVDGTAHQSN